jgi:osmotically-inducible protein OsmY
MKLHNVIYASMLAACFVGGISGCATSHKSEDSKINAEVQVLLDQRADLDAPSVIEVQTVNSTVYLSGLVSTDLQRESAAEVAHEVTGVVLVVNSISLKN